MTAGKGKHWLDVVVSLLDAKTSNLRELARIAGGDPTTFYRGISIKEIDVEDQEVGDLVLLLDTPPEQLELYPEHRFSKGSEPQSVWRVARQEERIAIILNVLIENPDKRRMFLHSYGAGRAQFERLALRLIEKHIDEINSSSVAVLIPRIVRLGFPMNKGVLLLYLAKHLARHSEINSAIRAITEQSSAFAVDQYRRSIQETLDDPVR